MGAIKEYYHNQIEEEIRSAKNGNNCVLPTKISWNKGDIVDNHDQLNVYSAYGISEDGRGWTGEWIEIHGEFSEIQNIEEA